MSISCEIARRRMPQDVTNEKSTLVQVLPDGTKPLPKAMMAHIYNRYMASLGHN